LKIKKHVFDIHAYATRHHIDFTCGIRMVVAVVEIGFVRSGGFLVGLHTCDPS